LAAARCATSTISCRGGEAMRTHTRAHESGMRQHALRL
jgi:hypothetical protein